MATYTYTNIKLAEFEECAVYGFKWLRIFQFRVLKGCITKTIYKCLTGRVCRIFQANSAISINNL